MPTGAHREPICGMLRLMKMRPLAVGLGLILLLSTSACGGDDANWWLARAPTPDQRSLALMVSERACASGASPEGRIQPEVTYNTDTIIVTIRVKKLGGAQDCQARAPTPYELQLDQPVGNRTVLDGSVTPPSAPRSGPG